MKRHFWLGPTKHVNNGMREAKEVGWNTDEELNSLVIDLRARQTKELEAEERRAREWFLDLRDGQVEVTLTIDEGRWRYLLGSPDPHMRDFALFLGRIGAVEPTPEMTVAEAS